MCRLRSCITALLMEISQVAGEYITHEPAQTCQEHGRSESKLTAVPPPPPPPHNPPTLRMNRSKLIKGQSSATEAGLEGKSSCLRIHQTLEERSAQTSGTLSMYSAPLASRWESIFQAPSNSGTGRLLKKTNAFLRSPVTYGASMARASQRMQLCGPEATELQRHIGAPGKPRQEAAKTGNAPRGQQPSCQKGIG